MILSFLVKVYTIAVNKFDFHLIYSESMKKANPPLVVINGGTFISDEGNVWGSPVTDVTYGDVNGGSFYGGCGSAFAFGDKNIKVLGTEKCAEIGRASCRERV